MNRVLILILLVVVSFSGNAQENQQVIWAGNMIDVVSGKTIKDALIVIEENKIVEVTKTSEKNRFKEIIDLSEYTVLPGLIDTHTHLTNSSYNKSIDVYELPIASYGILGVNHAVKTINAGFTTVRDVGGYFYSDVALRDAINKNWISGPRMYVSGKSLSITGGHGAWANWMSPNISLKKNPGNIVDGEDEMRKAVRTLIKNNVDLIKINATGGFGTSESIPGASSFSISEMRVAVEEANKRGLKVAAHAHGTDGIKNAIKAGVSSIEHATYLDQESIDLMKKHNVYMVMDILAARYDLIETNKDYSDKKLGENNNEMYKRLEENLYNAYKQQVKIAFGTDASIFEHGRNAEQFRLMVKAGMKEIDAIRSATIFAAELIGIEKKTGNIEPGKWADIIAVKGNPLKDITTLEKVAFVMKGGKIVKFTAPN